jgi:hypothetical protein
MTPLKPFGPFLNITSLRRFCWLVVVVSVSHWLSDIDPTRVGPPRPAQIAAGIIIKVTGNWCQKVRKQPSQQTPDELQETCVTRSKGGVCRLAAMKQRLSKQCATLRIIYSGFRTRALQDVPDEIIDDKLSHVSRWCRIPILERIAKTKRFWDYFPSLKHPKKPKGRRRPLSQYQYHFLHLNHRKTVLCRKLRIDFSSGDADSVQAALEDHVFRRVTAPFATCGAVYSTDLQDDHENTCHECGDVGQLIICDKQGCKFSFHLKCVGLSDVPDGDWFCKYCSTNPIDPDDGHHVYCVECGGPGNLVMCDAENCPHSYHSSCVGLSDDLSIVGEHLRQLEPLS